MKSSEFWRAAAEGTAPLRLVSGTQSPMQVGDVVVMMTADAPTRLKRAVVDQLALSYRQVIGGPDSRQLSADLSGLGSCASKIITSPFTSYVIPTTPKLSSNTPRSKDVDVGVVLPYYPPGLPGEVSDKLPSAGSPEIVDDEREIQEMLGLTILTSHALRAKARHSSVPVQVRKFTVAQYWAAPPTQKDKYIVRRQAAGTVEPVYALQENYVSTDNADALKVAASALKWVLHRGGYEAPK